MQPTAHEFAQLKLLALVLNSFLSLILTSLVMFASRILTPYFFFCVAFAETSSVSWTYPQKLDGNPSTVTINVVDTIVVEWKANFKPAYLWVWCNIGTTNAPNNDRCTL
jgi:hypothetical protein